MRITITILFTCAYVCIFCQNIELPLDIFKLEYKIESEISEPNYKFVRGEKLREVYQFQEDKIAYYNLKSKNLSIQELGDSDKPKEISSVQEFGLIVKTKVDVNYFNASNLKQKQASISLPFGGKMFNVGSGNTIIASTDLKGTQITQLSATGDVNTSSLQECTPFCRSCTVIGDGFESNNGNIQLVGQINEQHENSYFTTIVVTELDKELNLLRESKIPLSSNKKIISAIPTSDFGVVILTSSISNSCINSSNTVLKLNQNNEIEWEECLENLHVDGLIHSGTNVEISEFEDEFLITYLSKESFSKKPFILFLGKKSKEIELASLPFNSVSDIWTIDDKIYVASEKSIFSLAIKKLKPFELEFSKKNKFLIYPNPAQDQVNIYTTELESVYLYDNLGRLLSQIAIPQSSTASFDIKHLNDGVYFIMDKERKTIRKFVKISTN